MDHAQATQLMAVEKYLLDELTPEFRDTFEEHFFDCQICATDLRITAAFMEASKKEFSAHPVEKATTRPIRKAPLAFFRPALAWSALAASLLLIAYQNVVVYPGYQSQIAEMRAPEILPELSLVGGNSRSGDVPSIAVESGRPFLLSLDIPAEDRFSSYTCLLFAPSGVVVWRVEVSAQAAKETVSIRVPAVHASSGEYSLKVQGNLPGGATGVSLALDRFTIITHK